MQRYKLYVDLRAIGNTAKTAFFWVKAIFALPEQERNHRIGFIAEVAKNIRLENRLSAKMYKEAMRTLPVSCGHRRHELFKQAMVPRDQVIMDESKGIRGIKTDDAEVEKVKRGLMAKGW